MTRLPNLGALTVDSVAGTESGDTKITVSPAKESADHLYKYTVAVNAAEVTYGQNVKSWKNWDGLTDIAAASGKVITVVECTPSYRAQAAGHATVVAKA